MSRIRIETDDATQRWRFRCPAGHVNWEATNQHFWCRECARSLDDGHEPEFDELRDVKTGDLYRRSEIELTDYEDHLRHVSSD